MENASTFIPHVAWWQSYISTNLFKNLDGVKPFCFPVALSRSHQAPQFHQRWCDDLKQFWKCFPEIEVSKTWNLWHPVPSKKTPLFLDVRSSECEFCLFLALLQPCDSPIVATSQQRAVQRPVAPRMHVNWHSKWSGWPVWLMGPSVLLDVDLMFMVWILYDFLLSNH